MGEARQREAILRFYAAMTNTPYDDVVNEYLGKNVQPNWANRLYQATEMAISFMNESASNPQQKDKP